MTQANTLIAGAAAIALSLGVAGQGTIPKELRIPLGNKDIVIVKDEARPSLGQIFDRFRLAPWRLLLGV
jgi:hypothetical protein